MTSTARQSLQTFANDVVAVVAECAAKDAEIAERDRLLTLLYDEQASHNDHLRQLHANISDRDDQIERLKAELALYKPKFRMFDATARLVMGPGFEPMPVVGESRFYADSSRVLDLDYIRDVTLPKWREANPTATMLCIDDEHHGRNGYTDAEVAEMTWIATVIKDFDPTLNLLWYGIPPRSQNHLSGKVEAETAAWLTACKRLVPVLGLMDYGAISIYPLTTDPVLFDRYCRSNIQMWREVAGDKPVYPFVCPGYHRNAGAGEGTPIPAEMMRIALEACRDLADGLCIWMSAAKDRDRSQPWSAELDAFLL